MIATYPLPPLPLEIVDRLSCKKELAIRAIPNAEISNKNIFFLAICKSKLSENQLHFYVRMCSL